MSRMPYSVNERTSEAMDPDRNAPTRHCIVLTLIGLAAIAISIALPPDPKAPALSAEHSVSPASAAIAPAPEPIATTIDYFSAQFLPPQSDTQELPSTY